MRRLMVGVLVVAACGDDSGGVPDAEIGPPDAEAPGANEVTLFAFDIDYIRYRNGRGAWQMPAQDPNGNYVLRVSDDYQVVAACSNENDFDVSLTSSRYQDGPYAVAGCYLFVDSTPPPPAVQVSGQMAQAGDVWMDGRATSSIPAWDFVLDVEPGPHDLIAIDDTRALIRRGLSITGDTTVPAIDLDVEGAAMIGVPYTLDGVAPGDVVSQDVLWFADHDFARISGTGFEIVGPPPSLVAAYDWTDVDITVDGGSTYRSLSTSFELTQPSYAFELLPVLTGIDWAVDGDVVEASWDTLPDDVEVDVALVAGSSWQRVSASQSWIDLHGVSSLGFDVTPPDFDPAWRIEPDAPQTRMFFVFDYGPTFRSSAVSQVVGTALRSDARAQAAAEVVREHLVELRASRIGQEGVAGHDPAAAHRRLLRMLLRDRVEDLAE